MTNASAAAHVNPAGRSRWQTSDSGALLLFSLVVITTAPSTFPQNRLRQFLAHMMRLGEANADGPALVPR